MCRERERQAGTSRGVHDRHAGHEYRIRSSSLASISSQHSRAVAPRIQCPALVLMLPAILALLSSATYGAADFLGGLASRSASTTAVVIVSQFAGLVLLAVAMPFLPPSSVTLVDL